MGSKKIMVDGKMIELADEEGQSSSEEESGNIIDIDEEEGPVSNTYTKTTHEVNPEEVEKTGPKLEKIELDDLDEICEFGSIVQFITEG